jgi:hypothetical protein
MLMQRGVKVEGSSDRDSRYLCRQKAFVRFGEEFNFNGFKLYGNPQSEIGGIQDFWQMLAKLMDGATILQIGNHIATISHLQL